MVKLDSSPQPKDWKVGSLPLDHQCSQNPEFKNCLQLMSYFQVKYDQSKSVESIPLSNNANLIIKDSRFSLRFDDATATYTLSVSLTS